MTYRIARKGLSTQITMEFQRQMHLVERITLRVLTPNEVRVLNENEGDSFSFPDYSKSHSCRYALVLEELH